MAKPEFQSMSTRGGIGAPVNMPTLRILVAEDDPPIRELLTHHLEREGYGVIQAPDGPAALRAAREGVDCIVLDIGLPGVDGLDIARTLRREGRDVPILFLTARSDEVDRILGLELGGDDYVTKPFSPREIVARVRAIARRCGVPYAPVPAVLRFGRLVVDEAAREVRVDERDVGLKPREFSLLHTLASNPGVALSRATLLERVWGFDFEGDERTVDVHVRRIREKVEEHGGLGPCVMTVHGHGYKFARP